uniref:Uncharacterized protein n=1 Tax=Rhizophora mucronata TaxID=61149 RepID=A0A2P2IXL4_RHIMU
MSLPAGFKVET